MVSPGMVGDVWYSKLRHYFCGADGKIAARRRFACHQLPPHPRRRPALVNHQHRCARILILRIQTALDLRRGNGGTNHENTTQL
jgi:hypothetical protein